MGARMLGLTGAAVQLAMAVAIGGIAGGGGSFPNPPEPFPRGIALFLLLLLPAMIGALGAVSADRALLAAAAILAAAGSVIAFSGITIVFLASALCFAVAAGAGAAAAPRPRRPAWASAAILIVGGAVVVVAVLRIGIFALPLIVLGVLALSLAGVRRQGIALVGGAAVLLIVLAGVGAGWALLGLTETRCWEAYQTPSGIEYRSVPESTTHVVASPEMIAAGCDSGSLTARGAGIAAVLGLGAVAVAFIRVSRP
jgi:hypothetical protein